MILGSPTALVHEARWIPILTRRREDPMKRQAPSIIIVAVDLTLFPTPTSVTPPPTTPSCDGVVVVVLYFGCCRWFISTRERGGNNLRSRRPASRPVQDRCNATPRNGQFLEGGNSRFTPCSQFIAHFSLPSAPKRESQAILRLIWATRDWLVSGLVSDRSFCTTISLPPICLKLNTGETHHPA